MTQITDDKKPAPDELKESAKVGVSLHSTKSPGHTFTPIMKRPKDAVKSSLNEQENEKQPNNEQIMNKEQQPSTSDETLSSNQEKLNRSFTFSPIIEEENVSQKKNEEAKEAGIASVSATERIIPTASEKVPPKYRRLLIILLLLLLLTLAIFLLKPKTPENAQMLQEQGSSLPIEFRPVNEEEAKRAELEAKALQEAAQMEAAQAQGVKNLANMPKEDTVQPTQDMVKPEVNGNMPTNASDSSQSIAVTAPPVVATEPVEQRPVVPQQVLPVVQKPETTASVIYRPEEEKVAKANVERAKTAPSNNKPSHVVNTEKAPSKPHNKSVETKSAVASVNSKVLTVPKGVSLMQVFRDHQLNISDVNAMSKVNNIVSNLKAGEKITVQLDKNNRVTEMKIGSGGRFIRQANGSYIYK